jgi:hypothetical protein
MRLVCEYYKEPGRNSFCHSASLSKAIEGAFSESLEFSNSARAKRSFTFPLSTFRGREALVQLSPQWRTCHHDTGHVSLSCKEMIYPNNAAITAIVTMITLSAHCLPRPIVVVHQ